MTDETSLELGAAIDRPLVGGQRVTEPLRAVVTAIEFDDGMKLIEVEQLEVFRA